MGLRQFLDRTGKHFHKGGRYERWFPLYEAIDTLFYAPANVTKTGAHVRDALDLKRMMFLVVIAALPCVFMAMWNTGLQANLAIDPARIGELDGWRHALIQGLGIGYSPDSFGANFFHGALYFLPLYLVTMAVGGFWEVLFSVVRKTEINEGFFVTGLLFPLILPPTTPLWQAALGISFGVVLAKEVFGGVGMNFVNPALAARAFLFFAYPAGMSGDAVWTAVPQEAAVDGWSGATLLGQMRHAEGGAATSGLSWWDAFVGIEPGSMGETSALACLIGLAVILFTGVGSWRIVLSVTLGTIGMASLLNAIGSDTNAWFGVPFWWHMVLGGWAFATVFMATDPVTAPYSESGKWIYGVLIGAGVVLIRVFNPAYPESVMLVILLMNVAAPTIDYFFVRANVRQRDATTVNAPPRDVNSTRYTILFAVVVCVVCAALVSVAAVTLQPRQKANALLYMEKNVLLAAGLIEPGDSVNTQQVEQIFQQSIDARLVDLATGEMLAAGERDARRYDQRAARNDPATSRDAPPNQAGLRRLPNLGVAYLIKKDGAVDQVVIPVEGLGMWGTIYGFLSLDADGNTIRGLTYYDQKETPGLGGEIANPDWQVLWRGRKAFDTDWNVAIRVIKGVAGPPDVDPSRVDGISGSTITSNAITRLIQFWLGADGYGKFLQKFREGVTA